MRVIQQLFTAYIEECLHQHISTHTLATLAKTPRWLDGGAIRSIATGKHGARSTTGCPPLPSTTYARCWEKQQDIIITVQEQYISTGNNPVQVTVQQRQPLLRVFLLTNGRVSRRSGAKSTRPENRLRAAWNPIEETCDTIRPGEVQHHHPSGADVQGTGPYRRLRTSWRQHKTVFTLWRIMGCP